jgi:hypothetical protein
MKRYLFATLAALCVTAFAETAANAPIITDPDKIIQSTTYNLGDRLLTVQELTKEALPMPPSPAPVAQPSVTPARPLFRPRPFASISVGARIYKRANQPTRSLISYHIPGQQETITFWSSADWSLIAGIGSLTAPDGTIWQLFCMPSIINLDRNALRQQLLPSPTIPDMPAGASTYQIVSGNPTPEHMAPIALYHSYYDTHLAELQAAQQARIAEQQRAAAEALADPPEKKDITVQYRILAPEEIVIPTKTAPTTQEQ